MGQGYLFKDERGEHLHTLNGVPLTGTSSIMEIVSKPLTWWAVGEGLKILGWTPINEYKFGKRVSADRTRREAGVVGMLQQIKDMADKQFLELLDTAYYAHSKTKDKAATSGKDLHARLEDYIKSCIEKNGGVPLSPGDSADQPKIQAFAAWSVDNVEKFLWSELHTYSEKHALGGITDCGAKLKDGRVVIIDFKSSKAAYASQFWQIGGYDIQLEELGGFTSKGERVMEPVKIDAHIIIPFGASEFTVEIDNDTVANRSAFLAALTLYRERDRHEQ